MYLPHCAWGAGEVRMGGGIQMHGSTHQIRDTGLGNCSGAGGGAHTKWLNASANKPEQPQPNTAHPSFDPLGMIFRQCSPL